MSVRGNHETGPMGIEFDPDQSRSVCLSVFCFDYHIRFIFPIKFSFKVIFLSKNSLESEELLIDEPRFILEGYVTC